VLVVKVAIEAHLTVVVELARLAGCLTGRSHADLVDTIHTRLAVTGIIARTACLLGASSSEGSQDKKREKENS
jgi:hypothetical protein